VGQLHRRHGAVRLNGALITSTAGAFHIQPTTNPGSLVTVGSGVSLDDGAPATSGDDRNLRYDAAASDLTVMPELKRLNVFLTGNYEVTDNITAFGEVGVYSAKTHAFQAPTTTTSAQVITAPASNYWNPFGPTTFAGGANPNRIAGTTAPAAGLNVTLTSYDFVDAGKSKVDVTNSQNRFLGGSEGRGSRLQVGVGPAVLASQGRGRLGRHQRHGGAEATRPVDGRRLQPLQRRHGRQSQRRRRHPQQQRGDRRHPRQVQARKHQLADVVGLPRFEG
jgi:hypothetical protein